MVTERLALTCAEHLDLLRLCSVQVARWNRIRGSVVVGVGVRVSEREASRKEGSRTMPYHLPTARYAQRFVEKYGLHLRSIIYLT
ncbi:hypothetical protein [Nostoc sp.]|uniref:hypothetical protein n=1 Tax=Nostoc sp. TaxID=1180 RepID=UPI002FF95D72